VVETSYGKLAGTEKDGISRFRGIPFAQPPIGPRRWQPPQPPEPWAGVRDASRFGNPALQNPSMLGPMMGIDLGHTSEDCLYLNVWTPGTDSGRRPVLVWIHGGAFVMGSASQILYNGATLARRGDVVVVTINYRLGALGYLHLQELCDGRSPVASNTGLLDQIAALEWVQREIAAFGGDPSNVTVFGESAGSMSVAALLGTPRARGLFQRAILESGSANFVGMPKQATRVAEAVLKELGIAPAEAQRLHDVPAEAILEAQQYVFLSLQSRLGTLPFAPVVDGDVLPQHPFDAIADGAARDVAVLVGTNLDEMKLFALMDPEARTLDEAALIERCERRIRGTESHGLSYGRRAITTYREARRARGQSVEPAELWSAIDTDRTFRYPAMHLGELQSAHQPHTYAYLFTWSSPFMEGRLGSCHALEVPFVFGTLAHPMLARFVGSGPIADVLAEHIQDAWITFAHTRCPGHSSLGDWPGYERRERATMVLGADSHVENAPFEEERSFWGTI